MSEQRVLKDVIQDKLPRLHSHLETNNVDLSLFTFNWFLTVFVDNIPVNTYLRIWDTFLYEGNKVILVVVFLVMCSRLLSASPHITLQKRQKQILFP